jgi:amino acid adenylation domain-containing protein
VVREQVTVLNQTPAAFAQVAALDARQGADLALRLVIFGGEALEPSRLAAWWARHDATRPQLVNMYGITETTVHVTYRPLRAADSTGGARSPIGRPLPDLALYLLDARGEPVPLGAAGEIYVGGAGVARGYQGRPELTAERFVPDRFSGVAGARLYRSGDRGRWTAQGELEYLGRSDAQVKLRGYRIEPGEIAAQMREHPAVQDAVVVLREDTLSETEQQHKRLVAYVVQEPGYHEAAAQAEQWQSEQVAQWATIFDETYRQRAGHDEPTFNITGWNSSYTGQAIPAAEMREWVDHTVERILQWQPRRVLEIGCGTGLLLFRVAPHCDYYCATDFSDKALRYIRQHLPSLAQPLPPIDLWQRAADDFTQVAAHSFDAVILNSVIQYFPSAEYLVDVLNGAIQAVRSGGVIFVGDVRSLSLLNAFYASVELHQAPAATTRAQLRQQMHKQLLLEQELVLDPAFFFALKQQVPQIAAVQILPKRGRHDNEMTLFRYDVLLHIRSEQAPTTLSWQRWQPELGIAALQQMLETQPEIVALSQVPNARLRPALKAAELLLAAEGPATAEELRAAVEQQSPSDGLHPEAVYALGAERGYTVELRCSAASASGAFDLVLRHGPVNRPVLLAPAQEPQPLKSWRQYANNPLQGLFARQFAPQLRSFLEARLPEYMIPASFILLDSLPLTSNGKLDRRALPAPDHTRPELESSFVAPGTPDQQALAEIWQAILGIAQVGIHDNFFALGGHSLLATQVITRVRDRLQVDLPLRSLFEAPTIAGLSEQIAAARQSADPAEVPPIQPVPRGENLPLSFTQQRLWFLDQLQPGSFAYNIPTLVRLSGRLDLPALERSLNAVIRRHEALRTAFLTSEGRPRQVILPGAALSLPLIDLRTLPLAQRQAEALRQVGVAARQPFDLSHAPLLRAMVLQLDEQEYLLFLMMHHIVSDGWSIGVLIQELATLYTACLSQQPNAEQALPPLPIQYVDYTIWQQEWLGQRSPGGIFERQMSYWKRQLADLPTLDLPTDYPRPAVQSYTGGSFRFLIPPSLSAALAALSERKGVTLFMTLLTAFQTLLARYSGQTDIVVGTPIANRRHAELERLIGFFVNTLVLRSDLGGNPSFDEALERVREVCLGAYAHQDLPFDLLVDEIQPARDLSRVPLFQVLFVLQNAPLPALQLPNLSLQAVEIDSGASKFDLTLFLDETPRGINGLVEYASDLFEAATIARLVGHFQNILQALASDSTQRIADVALLTQAEQRQLLHDWNTTEVAFPLDRCLHQLFEEQAARTPDATAVVFEQARLSYAELNRRANQLARVLVRHGVGPDVLVALYAERSSSFLIAILAVFKAGGAYLPLDPRLPASWLGQVLSQSQPLVALVGTPLLDSFAQALEPLDAQRRPAVLSLDELLRDDAPAADLPARATPRNLAYVIYTSGSTGQPKGAMVEHRGMLNHALAKVADLRLSAQDRVAQTASQSFDISVWQFLSALLVGGQVQVVPDAITHDPMQLLTLVEQQTITILEVVPSLLRAMLDELARSDRRHFRLSALRWLLLTGEALPPDVCRTWLAWYPAIPLLNAYGPTECSDDVTHHPILEPPPAEVVHLPIGRPIANTRLYILDGRGQIVPLGVPGQLWVGGVGVGRGYLNDPARTAAAFGPDPFGAEPGARLYQTGDRARFLADGTIEFLGRLDHQVKVRGYRIELGEITAALNEHPAVRESVVVAHEDRAGHKRLIAYVVGEQRTKNQEQTEEPGTREEENKELEASGFLVGSSELRAFLKERLPEYMVPANFVILDALPLTANGKLDRKALPLPDTSRPELESLFVAPRTPQEQTLAGIWMQVLHLDQVGVYDNFFELGGDSIRSIQIIAKANQAGLRLTPQDLFQHQTIAELAAVATTTFDSAPPDDSDPFAGLTQDDLDTALDQVEFEEG